MTAIAKQTLNTIATTPIRAPLASINHQIDNLVPLNFFEDGNEEMQTILVSPEVHSKAIKGIFYYSIHFYENNKLLK